jgi:hypothetical protein
VVAGDDTPLVFNPDNDRAVVSSDLITWNPAEIPDILGESDTR